MRGFRSTLILLVIFLGLLAYIYFVESKRPAEDEAAAKPKVFTLDSATIEELSIKAASGERSELKKSKDAWTLVQPAQAAVDASEVSSITSGLSNLEIQRVVEEKPSDLKQYGLAEPRVDIAFKAQGGETRRLLIGDKTATGGDLYAKLPNETRVFLIAGYLDSTFNRTPFDLRDKTILKFERDTVDALEIEVADGNQADMRFAKSGDTWQMIAPVEARADVPAIEGVVGRLQTAQMKSIVAQDESKLKEFGLDRPSVTVTVGTGSGRHRLMFGKEAPESAVYAREATRPMVVTVDKSLLDDIRKPASDFRDKDVFKFRAFNAERIELARGRDTLVYEKSKAAGGTEETWKQVSPASKDVDATKMDTLLTRLANLRAKSFADRKVKAGLESPVLTVRAKYDAGKEERVSFGKPGDNVYASRDGDPGAMQLEASEFNDAIKALDDLQETPAPAKKP